MDRFWSEWCSVAQASPLFWGLFRKRINIDAHENLQQFLAGIDKYKPFDKAGAYAIQEWIGVVGIKSISGDFYNVMGLPVSKVVQAINSLNS